MWQVWSLGNLIIELIESPTPQKKIAFSSLCIKVSGRTRDRFGSGIRGLGFRDGIFESQM